MFDKMSADELLAVAPASLSGPALSEHLVALARLRAAAEAALLATVGVWDGRQEWAADVCVNGATWLAHHASMSRAEAGAVVRDARLLAHHPVSAAACATVGPERARLVVRACTAATEAVFARDETMLVDQAARLTVDDTRRMVAFWKRHADAEGAATDDGRLRERRYVRLSQYGPGNWRLDGELDAEAGLIVHESLQAVSDELFRAEHGCDDGQPATGVAQRRADALVELAIRGRAVDPERSITPKPLLMAICDLEVLERRAGRTCELDGAGVITPTAAHRLACEAGIARVITDGASTPLDLGTTTPTPSAAQRRAVRIRDGGCAVPACDRPPAWCDIHHIVHRTNGGPTNLDNLVMLCRRHHRLHHDGQLGITRTPTGHLVFTRSDNTTITAHPRAA